MNSIFEKLKSFSHIDEASKSLTSPPENTTKNVENSLKLYIVTVPKNEYPEFAKAMKMYKVLEVMPMPKKTDTYYVIMDSFSRHDDILSYIKEMGTKNDSVKLMEVDDAARETFDTNYFESLDKRSAEYEAGISGGNLDRYQIAAYKAAMKMFRRALNAFANKQASGPATEKKAEITAKVRELSQKAKIKEEMLDEQLGAELKEITAILNGIDYANEEVAMYQIARAVTSINSMKESGTLTPFYEKRFNNKLVQIKKDMGMPDEAFKNGVENGVGTRLMYYINKFEYTTQKSEDQIAEEYSIVMDQLESQRKLLLPEDYDKLKEHLEMTMQTKIAVIKGIKEHPELVVDSGSAPDKPGTVEIGANAEGDTTSVYQFKVQLPIGRPVSITNIEQYKVEKGKVKEDENETDAMKKSILARAEVSVFNMLGYRPKAEASAVIASYAPFRQHMGEVTQWAAKNTIGILASVMGKNGKEFGEGVGKFLKYELIGDPLDVNPALAQSERWLRNRFNVLKMLGTEKKVAVSANPDNAAAVARFEKNVSEQAVAAPAPASSGTAPGGDGMNMPGMITGAGDPIAPTKTAPGSGDNFNPKKKKNRKPLREHVLDYKKFVLRMYDAG